MEKRKSGKKKVSVSSGVLSCPCFNLQEVTIFDVPVSPDESQACGMTPDNPWKTEVIEAKHTGQWCVVDYDNEAYPGVIKDAEGNTVKVKCMHHTGINKFHWPSLREDMCWYHVPTGTNMVPRYLA
ncbi:hypothetical protein XENOCAPTIV_030133 [Xenoophorus captivus]|uniref:Uncharacterized protein n=1 Tax=Xenoophorus captivus TaxID=1517983 RepID=A0ABV0REA6_9TELE